MIKDGVNSLNKQKNKISDNMTNEWIDWSSENRIRTPLRGSFNNFTNNNQSNYKIMGLKSHSVMKSLQRPKGNF